MPYVSTVGVEVVRVVDKGKLSTERVILRMAESLDLINIVILNAHSKGENELYDMNEHVYWFPSVVANQGDYVRVYTKEGEYRLTTGKYSGKPARFHNFYWNVKTPIWQGGSNSVVVMRIKDWMYKKVL